MENNLLAELFKRLNKQLILTIPFFLNTSRLSIPPQSPLAQSGNGKSADASVYF